MANGRGGTMKRIQRWAWLLLLTLPAGCLPHGGPRTAPPLPLSAPFSKQQLAGVIYPTEIYWLGNDRLLFRGFDQAIKPGTGSDKKGLYLWDLKGPARLLLANSQDLCVAGKEVQVGVEGKVLTQLRWLRLRLPDFRPEPLPQPPELGDFWHFDPARCQARVTPEYFRGRHWDPLPDGAGYLDYGLSEDRPRLNQPVYYWDRNLRRRQDTGIRMDLPPSVRLEESKFDNSYLVYPLSRGIIKVRQWERDGSLRIWRIQSDLKSEKIEVPYGPWVGSFFRFLPSRQGLIITNNDFSPGGKPRQAGAYLMASQGKSQQLERGFVQDPVVSSDGCRLAYAYQFRLDADIKDGGKRLVVVDLCGNKI